MGDLAIATLVNVTRYERDNATLIFEMIFETQYKTIEVHTTHTPLHSKRWLYIQQRQYIQPSRKEFQIIKRDGGVPTVEVVVAR
jgi:hypothetical protein